MTTVWVYVDTSKEVGDVDHLKAFANEEAAETWLEENDPDGGRSNMRFSSEPDRAPIAFHYWLSLGFPLILGNLMNRNLDFGTAVFALVAAAFWSCQRMAIHFMGR